MPLGLLSLLSPTRCQRAAAIARIKPGRAAERIKLEDDDDLLLTETAPLLPLCFLPLLALPFCPFFSAMAMINLLMVRFFHRPLVLSPMQMLFVGATNTFVNVFFSFDFYHDSII